MTAANDKKAAFLSGLAQALEDKTFVKLALGKYRGQGEPRKSVVTLVLLKGLPHLKFVTSYGRKDETKNFALAEGIDHVGSMVGYPYLSATLFTTKRDTTLTYSKKGEPHLATGRPTLQAAAPVPHDRTKAYLVAPDRPYLKALQVSDAEGRVKPSMQGKYRQICHFIDRRASI